MESSSFAIASKTSLSCDTGEDASVRQQASAIGASSGCTTGPASAPQGSNLSEKRRPQQTTLGFA
eukprot:CAMPEP_0206530868 /NCGR_PEP_ID=MMETSP0325_2-20121206/3435_1 /ASSEMBLY_ACC=CAM_ASM_000347 /TAXON_ID=2866 /ORGANISM="Crypthecodinium cohnii, Strain Seligo" /LENGTH=64 /DNA_ID=CAMNT_0054027021 /DNA_START=151 /DNA_END=345 /DNA_ORIENTATION=-